MIMLKIRVTGLGRWCERRDVCVTVVWRFRMYIFNAIFHVNVGMVMIRSLLCLAVSRRLEVPAELNRDS